jgi:DeoR/GlpR family transcriptional regulator of sugar metabolism
MLNIDKGIIELLYKDHNQTHMLVEERFRYILNLIESIGSVNNAELVAQFGVSEMTIRRDLRELENAGHLRRVRGGAVSARGRAYEPPFVLRVDEEADAKIRIGRQAAALIGDGATVALDVGTTTLQIARHIAGRSNLTVLTPSLRIASLLSEQPHIRTIISGGIIRAGELSLVGELAEQACASYFVDKLFLGVGGISVEAGLTEYNIEDVRVKRAMLRSAKEVIVVADASKFNQVAFGAIAPLSAVNRLVTDQSLPRPLAQACAEHRIEVIIAGA